ncbi:MAG: DUF2442 domain-containing protein [Marivita sp.]|uniref:DUF2442 domain-containing protein n=1 Tax=Marivita sp. TaxID=2003365 RepID=UPI003EF84398
MTISATEVTFDEHTMWVSLEDGRILGVPLGWFPRLAQATPEQLTEVQISAFGLHWDALDEDVSIPALLEGRAAVEDAA